MPPAIMVCMSDTYPGMKSNAADEIRYIDRYVKAGVSSTTGGSTPAGILAATGWGTRRHLGARPAALSQGAPRGRRPRPRQRHEDRRLVRAGAGHPGHVAGRAPSRMGPGRQKRRAAEPRQPRGAEVADRARRQDDRPSRASTSTARTSTWTRWAIWRGNDPPDRQGITEIRHVEGFLAYWDELRRRHPDMLIDTCASGGRRNDLETLRRAVPLVAERLPFRARRHPRAYLRHGALDSLLRHGRVGRQRLRRPQPLVSLVGNRSQRGPRERPDWTNYRRMIDRVAAAAPYFSGDYYPLTSYSLDETAWMAWQFDRPDLGEGWCRYSAAPTVTTSRQGSRSAGWKPDARYIVTDLDSGRSHEDTGDRPSGD